MLKVGSKREITSADIEDETLKRSGGRPGSHVRFAAVYKAFDDLGQFIAEIRQLGRNWVTTLHQTIFR